MLVWMPVIAAEAAAADLQTGDLVFVHSATAQSTFVARATGSRWTHVGVVVVRDGRPEVLEAGDPVGYTPLATFVARSADDRVAVKRLDDADAVWTPEVRARAETVAEGWLGKRYDPKFAWTDDAMYCSELVYKLYAVGAERPIGTLRTFGSFDLSDPEVLRAVKARWGTVPTDETVVSPADLFADPHLVTVCDGPRSTCP